MGACGSRSKQEKSPVLKANSQAAINRILQPVLQGNKLQSNRIIFYPA